MYQFSTTIEIEYNEKESLANLRIYVSTHKHGEKSIRTQCYPDMLARKVYVSKIATLRVTLLCLDKEVFFNLFQRHEMIIIKTFRVTNSSTIMILGLNHY